MKKFFIQTFGCQMNVYDSERVAVMLKKAGWEYTEDPEEADLIIINTCSVREKPLLKVFSCTGRFLPLRKRSGVRIFVMGCVAQQLKEQVIEKAPYVDGVFGPGSEDQIPQAAEGDIFPYIATASESLLREEIFPESSRGAFFEPYSACVTIMHGCNNFCSYCIVPFVRGREVSRTTAAVIDEVRVLVGNGVKDVTLLGQNVNSYRDPETGSDFADLLEQVSAKTGVERLRFITSHPKDFGERLAKAFRDIPNLMPYLHLPAQSGNNRILGEMNRRYTVENYLEKMELARKYCPDIALSSDFIVGFPGETRSEFEDTMKLVDRVCYDSIFAFNYSVRPFTKASKMADDVPEEEKFERLNRLLDLQRSKIKEVRGRYLGRTIGVLVESESPRGGTLMGRSEHNLVTHVINSEPGDVGKIVKVKVTEILENTLRGEKIKDQ
ncbi:tRNA (N6-isopentenyl adenosine(37)-C2)-methylthiotransferase MiaB [bacterium]|nr:tRNA (N6-isopentenyl adenosine(37)-C2)-methylthiotransferase MiaB [bacterium]